MIHPSVITVTDVFCGAGGSTACAVQAGASVRLAVNHWRRFLTVVHIPPSDVVIASYWKKDE